MEALPWTGFTEDCEVEGNPDPSEGAGVCKPRLPTHNNWIGKYSYEGKFFCLIKQYVFADVYTSHEYTAL